MTRFLRKAQDAPELTVITRWCRILKCSLRGHPRDICRINRVGCCWSEPEPTRLGHATNDTSQPEELWARLNSSVGQRDSGKRVISRSTGEGVQLFVLVCCEQGSAGPQPDLADNLYQCFQVDGPGLRLSVVDYVQVASDIEGNYVSYRAGD